MVAEQDSINEAANEILPIFPHMLLKLHGKDFAEVLQKQKEHLLKDGLKSKLMLLSESFKNLSWPTKTKDP